MIMSYFQIADQIAQWQTTGLTVVFATGVFDVLHEEHKRFLHQAKIQGDKLVVGFETDTRVRQMKGEGRPINPLSKRLHQVNQLIDVDVCFSLPESFSQDSDWITCMQTLHPDIYAISSNSPHKDNKQKISTECGVECRIVHQHNPNISTTQLIEKSSSKNTV